MNRRHFLRNGLWVAGASIFVPRLLRAQYMPMADPAFLASANNKAVSSVIDVTDGLVGWWKLDDASGPTADDSVGTNDGTLVATPTWATGKTGGCLSFNGSNQYVYANAPGALSGVSAATLCMWLYRSASNVKVAAGIVSSTTNLYRFCVVWYSAGDVYWFPANGDANHYRSTPNTATGWHHFAMTFSGGTLAAYIDGSSVSLFNGGSLPATLATTANAPLLWIGREYSQGFCAGSVDDVRLYSRAITPTEVTTVYTTTGGGS